MLCNYYDVAIDGGDEAFSIDASNITFGPGCLRESGDIAKNLGISRIAVFTDNALVDTEHVATVLASLKASGVDVALYDNVRVEPTDESFKAGVKFATMPMSTASSRSVADRSSTPPRQPTCTPPIPPSSWTM